MDNDGLLGGFFLGFLGILAVGYYSDYKYFPKRYSRLEAVAGENCYGETSEKNGYIVRQVIPCANKVYKFKGGQPANLNSWEELTDDKLKLVCKEAEAKQRDMGGLRLGESLEKNTGGLRY